MGMHITYCPQFSWHVHQMSVIRIGSTEHGLPPRIQRVHVLLHTDSINKDLSVHSTKTHWSPCFLQPLTVQDARQDCFMLGSCCYSVSTLQGNHPPPQTTLCSAWLSSWTSPLISGGGRRLQGQGKQSHCN